MPHKLDLYIMLQLFSSERGKACPRELSVFKQANGWFASCLLSLPQCCFYSFHHCINIWYEAQSFPSKYNRQLCMIIYLKYCGHHWLSLETLLLLNNTNTFFSCRKVGGQTKPDTSFYLLMYLYFISVQKKKKKLLITRAIYSLVNKKN